MPGYRERIHVDAAQLAQIAARHKLCDVWLYGSVLRDDFDPETSDVDVMVTLPESCAHLVNVDALKLELSKPFGREADVVCMHRMNPHYVREVITTGVCLWNSNPNSNQSMQSLTLGNTTSVTGASV